MAIDIAGAAGRVALTFLPVVLLKKVKGHHVLRRLETSTHPDVEEKRTKIMRKQRNNTILFHILLFTPIFLFWATLMASLERTPLTGRWRLILLSPEEEDDIAAQLAGQGWYSAVADILAQDGPVKLIDPADWRLVWVHNTLHRLEGVIPVLQREGELLPNWMEYGPDDVPLPPPAEFPLRPRPRASDYLRRMAEFTCARTSPPPPHGVLGPPYSLIVVDKPDSSNAFSYGFGPNGAGGIVVFSGFLNEVLSKHPPATSQPAPPQPTSWWSALFGGLFTLASPLPAHSAPTEEQTSQLAILLAHELAHLILAHHIETLSSGSIIWPGITSIATDIVRTLLFPVTMLFGPFINDALASVGKVSTGEITRISEYCTSQKQEVEADVVSARLLAHAGFDPRHAVHFWEGRTDTPQTAECSPALAQERFRNEDPALQRRWMGETHPLNTERVERLKAELVRWENARRDALRARQREQEGR
ncbi:peptidase family M48-domain-containing protein [Amylocystis lapponica]|nr:peptidase family M48-domain-containing protein [Amylocystis lapponica]